MDKINFYLVILENFLDDGLGVGGDDANSMMFSELLESGFDIWKERGLSHFFGEDFFALIEKDGQAPFGNFEFFENDLFYA